MGLKIVATGTSLVITDTDDSNAVVYEQPLKNLWFDTTELDAVTPAIRIVPLNISIKKGYRVLISNSLTSGDVAYTAATWRTFAQANLSKGT